MKLLVSLFAVGVCFGPAVAGTTLKTVPKDYDPAPQGECIVVGRFDYVFNPRKPEKPHGKVANKMGNPTLTVKNVATRKRYDIDLEGPRWDFYVALPPGFYDVTDWTSGSLRGDPPVVFEVAPCRPEPGSPPEVVACPVRYIGTLKYARETGAKAFWKTVGTNTIPGRWEVVDESEEALKGFGEGYPQWNCPAQKSLFQLTD